MTQPVATSPTNVEPNSAATIGSHSRRNTAPCVMMPTPAGTNNNPKCETNTRLTGMT